MIIGVEISGLSKDCKKNGESGERSSKVKHLWKAEIKLNKGILSMK